MTSSSTTSDKVQSRNFSRTFEQMCNFIAVSKTGNPKETIKGLITLCLLELQPRKLFDAASFRETIETLFGVMIPLSDIESGLDSLENEGAISRPISKSYVLNNDIKSSIRQKVEDARHLEKTIKSSWFKEIEELGLDLDLEATWCALQAYLARSFRRHGIQTAALIDSSIETPNEIEVSLSVMLHDAIEEFISKDKYNTAHRIISDFLAQVGSDDQRTRYITQLADGAFNFYTLEVPPDLAESFRSKLHELTILLDTNFLFGIMDLHYNQQVQVSHDLLRVIHDYKLPFKLRYHEATAKEMKYTISIQGDALRSKKWSGALSRAASTSRNLSGIEQKFHEKNAKSQIDVDEFLRPFEHFDQILKDKNIEIYRPHQDREQARIDLYHEYNDFLERWGTKDKHYETVMHDATVLEEVRHIRSRSKSSLEAGSLFITCDYKLYRFDWKESKRNGHQACVLLPNIFWQILRPFIPGDSSFEKAFAETFALPEFRALSSGGSKACSKMLGILASYKDISEETAFKMLSNDLLIDNLRLVKDDNDFAQQVENAIVDENNALLEEQVLLRKKIDEERIARDKEKNDLKSKTQELESEKENLTNDLLIKNSELSKSRQEIQEIKNEATNAKKIAHEVKESHEKIKAETEKAQRERDEEHEKTIHLHKQVESLSTQSGKHQQDSFYMSILAGFLLGILFNVILFAYTYLKPWSWLTAHPKSLSLQISFSLMLLCISLGLTVSRWRKWCWGTCGLALVLTLLTLV